MVKHLIQDQLRTYDKDGDGEIGRKEFLRKRFGYIEPCVVERVSPIDLKCDYDDRFLQPG